MRQTDVELDQYFRNVSGAANRNRLDEMDINNSLLSPYFLGNCAMLRCPSVPVLVPHVEGRQYFLFPPATSWWVGGHLWHLPPIAELIVPVGIVRFMDAMHSCLRRGVLFHDLLFCPFHLILATSPPLANTPYILIPD